ncbi:hypothetical protein QFZ30_004269 [Arthrobacter pascens]|nr:hypothetical protein [Arthrobacter pascens]
MCCQFSSDSVGRASYPVVADKGKLDSASSDGWISLFHACQWELFHKDSRFTDTDCLGCSANTYANRLSCINKRPHAGIIEPCEYIGDTSGFICTYRHHYTLKAGLCRAWRISAPSTVPPKVPPMERPSFTQRRVGAMPTTLDPELLERLEVRIGTHEESVPTTCS